MSAEHIVTNTGAGAECSCGQVFSVYRQRAEYGTTSQAKANRVGMTRANARRHADAANRKVAIANVIRSVPAERATEAWAQVSYALSVGNARGRASAARRAHRLLSELLGSEYAPTLSLSTYLELLDDSAGLGQYRDSSVNPIDI